MARPVRLGDVAARHRTRSRTTRPPAGTTRTRAIMLGVYRQPEANTVEVVDRVKALLPSFDSQLPRGASLHVLNDRSRLDPRRRPRRAIHARPHDRPGHPRHLPLPAPRHGDDHSGARRADLAGRHARRHVPARLQHRQHLAAGADAVGRPRRRRRHRHAREHLPPHGGGRARGRSRRRSREAARSASPSCRSRSRWSPCSSPCC